MCGNFWRLAGIGLVLVFGCNVNVCAEADAAANTRDTLVYKDGDRIHGSLVRKSAEEIVFRSDRFGELRVKAADAVVIPGVASPPKPDEAKPAPTVAATAPQPQPSAEAEAKARAKAVKEEEEEERVTIWDRFSPGVLTANVRKFFGPWGGRLMFSTEVVSDVADRNNHSVEAKLSRKWKNDEVQMTARYDYAETNNVPTTDILRASGSWRHQFNKKWFAQYRPSAEWNHASRRQGVPNDYVLLQQEIGLGYNVFTSATRTVRTGVSQNLFDIWNSAPTPDHTSRGVQSVFEEVELKLPWRMGLTQRGVYYPVQGQKDGWENRIELNKKLTETLSTSVRHEIRRNNPDGSAQDYTRLKLMFGLDF